MVTSNDTSSPFTLPSVMATSPCRPDTVPVSLSPSALRLNVCSRVCPSRPGTCATHLPVAFAARAAVEAARTSTGASKDSFDFIACSFGYWRS